MTSCQQTAAGDYFIFDRRSHAVFVAPAGLDTARKLITIGAEPGRLLDPSAFDLGDDDSFVVADAPRGEPRVQIFLTSGSTVTGFRLSARAVPRITAGNLVLGGLAAIEYTGRSIFLSQPELGALIAEYATDGRPLRAFGALRKTGHEHDPAVHLALNAGLVVINPVRGLLLRVSGRRSAVPKVRCRGAAALRTAHRRSGARSIRPGTADDVAGAED